ncbi:MAG: protein BatD [Vallitaleaceae bacterium]|nr:protein BatD [Vallitaleaceae bacterium]
MIGKRKLRKIISVGVLFLLMTINIAKTGLTVYAEESSVRLDIDSQNLEVGVSSNLTLTIENMKGAELQSIEGLENFDVLSSSQATSTQIINSSSSTQIQVSYVLMPKTVGDFQLTGYVSYKGKTYATNVLDVHVGEKSTSTTEASTDIFVKTILSKDSIYFGQKVVLTYELYSRYNIEDYGFVDALNLDGFISKDLPTEELKASYETINGNKYVKYEVKKAILTPITEGTIKIPACNFQVNVSTGDFFNSSEAVYISTEEKVVDVKALPLSGQPSNFTGLVGQLAADANYSAEVVDYEQSITLKVTLSGDCNLEILNTLGATALRGFNKYESEKDLVEDVSGGDYSAQKEFEWILVPQTTGKIDVKPISINYFDDTDKTYKEVVIPGKTIQVNGVMPTTPTITGDTGAISEPALALEPILIAQINPSETDPAYFTIKKSYVYTVMVVILLILVMVAIGLYINKRQLKQDAHLQQLYKRIQKSKDQNTSYDLLNEMIKYRYQISLKASSREDIKNTISNETLIKSLFAVMDQMEMKHRQESNHSFNFKEEMKRIYKEIK